MTKPGCPVLVLVSGPPCAGKTTLGRRLAGEVGLPFLNKDGIKERLFDSLGWQDRAWSIRVGQASIAVLYYFIEAQLAAGQSLVAESNFKPALDNSRLREVQARTAFRPVQIHCDAAAAVLEKRYRQRAESGERHPGHVDHTLYAEFKADAVRREHAALELPGPLFEVDTSDFTRLDYNGLHAQVRQALADAAAAPTATQQ